MPSPASFVLRCLLVLLLGLAGGPAVAQCLPIAALPGKAIPAAYRLAEVPGQGSVRIGFLGHASFLIETAAGVNAVTDYNDRFRPPVPVTVATMNNAHETHFTEFPDAAIPYVLRGWNPAGGMAVHDVEVKDLRVRNVPTNVRDFGGTRVAGNSIFVFETAGLCIAHLGHLHHELTDVHLNELRIIDVLMVPVDGSFTASQETMRTVIRQIKPAVILPMHWFSEGRLAQFLQAMQPDYTVQVRQSPTILLSRPTLPRRTVVVLPGLH